MSKGIFQKYVTIIFTALFLLTFQLVPVIPQHASAATVDHATMISVVNQNGESLIPMTVVELKKDETAFDVLKRLTKKQKVDFKYTMDPKYGAFITKIGKGTLPGKSYWGFFINGVTAQKGASGYTVKPGDDLLFKAIKDAPKTINATVNARDKNDKQVIKESTVKVTKGISNAYDALKQAAKTSGIKLNVSIDTGMFAFINNIGGTKLDKDAGDYWSSSINNAPMQVGLATYKIKDGDHLELSIVASAPQVSKVSKQQITDIVKATAKYVMKDGVGSAFEAIGVKNAGQTIPEDYLKSVKQTLQDNKGDNHNVTDYERMALGVTAAGGNAANIAGYDLIKKIYSNDHMTNQGTNGVVYALVAYDSGKYKVPSNAKWTRDKLVHYLLDQQLNKGGWALSGSDQSVDMTAMTLAALAPYQDQSKVKTAIDKAVQWLSDQYKHDQFSRDVNGGNASETTAQVIVGLTAVGDDPTGGDFTKDKENLVQNLLSYRQKDNGFTHISGDSQSNSIATEQALQGLTGYLNFLNKKGSIYQFAAASSGMAAKADDAKEKTPKQTSTNTFIIIGGILLIIIVVVVIYLSRRKKRASKK